MFETRGGSSSPGSRMDHGEQLHCAPPFVLPSMGSPKSPIRGAPVPGDMGKKSAGTQVAFMELNICPESFVCFLNEPGPGRGIRAA